MSESKMSECAANENPQADLTLRRAGEQAVPADTSMEQESVYADRAAQTQTLIRTIEQLCEHGLADLPGIVLAAIVDQLGAAGGTLYDYDEATDVCMMVLDYEGGRVVAAADFSQSARKAIDHGMTPGWERVKAHYLRGECILATDEFRDHPAFDEEMGAALEAMGIRTVLVVPLLLRGRIIGSYVVRSPRREKYGPQELVLAQELAHQATLAMVLTRLADRAREAAVREERERAAAQRVAELTRANQALLHTLDALATAPDLDRCLETVIAAITEQLGASSSSLWLVDWEAQLSSLQFVYQDGRVIPASESGHPQPIRGILEDMRGPESISLFHERRTLVFEVPGSTLIPPEIRDYLMAMGVKQVVTVPLALGERMIGAFIARINESTPIPPEKTALAQALAHQATHAIQVSRLAERVRQSAVLGERNRIAREIHDTLAQTFTGILSQLGAAELVLDRRPEQGLAHLRKARDLAREGLAEARRSVQALRPQALEEEDLASALERMTQQMIAEQPTRVEFQLNGIPRAVPADVAHQLLRIGQEALTNALQHAKASEIRVELTFGAAELRLRVTDDGRGFVVDAPRRRKGFGLTVMQERARLIEARFAVSRQPARGTQVEVTWRFRPGKE